MKIFSAAQIREWDQYTIQHEPIESIDLMERAAAACARWIVEHFNHQQQFHIFCGSGNNGGDGLAIARMLISSNITANIYFLPTSKRSNDCNTNYERLVTKNITVNTITNQIDFPSLDQQAIVIDALFGTGLNKPLQGIARELVNHLNQSGARIISIDMPSGLYADTSSAGNSCIKATATLSFQCYKKAFMMPENESFIGEVHLLDIGLHPGYYLSTNAELSITDNALVQSIYQPRKKFVHKYQLGHALLFAGSVNMMGAAILCSKAVMRSGAGLVTVHCLPATGHIIQTALPEAIVSTENDLDKITTKKAAIGIGPGLEINDVNSALLQSLIVASNLPLVIDASALQLLTAYLQLLGKRTAATILTPHTGEFEKLFGKSANDFERMKLAQEKACELNCYIVLKGHYTFIASPHGEGWFNSTGNSGMATAGSGDVLTGIITGLLAQGYSAHSACVLGTYLHGLAGDIAIEKNSAESLIASDIIDHLGPAYIDINKNSIH